jgi:hypothetical protein
LPKPSPRLLTLSVVAFALVHATYAAWTEGWTYDEPFHLLWSQHLLDSGVTERESQHRLNTKTPLMLVNVLSQKLAHVAMGDDPRRLRLAARLPSVAWLAALLGATFALARRVAGEAAALIATAGTALDPSLTAHGSLATVDVPYAVATLLTLAAALSFARAPSPLKAMLVGAALGLAFATKFTAFLLLPALLLMPLAAKAPESQRPGRRVLGVSLLAGAMAALTVLGAFYLFHEMWMPLGTLTLKSAPLKRLAAAMPWLALPLPAAFLTGLDLSLVHESLREGNVVLLGRLYPAGTWLYFPFLWLVKTPLLALGILLVGLGRCGRDRIALQNPAVRYVAANLLLTLAYFSLAFRTQLGYRYVLMCIPLVWVVASAGLAPTVSPRRWRWAGAAVVLASLVEAAAYFGNPLSFTNAAVWPKRRVFRLIADSNVDWGQNRDKIGRWLAEAGVGDSHLDPLHLLPGHNTIDLNALAGVWDFEQHRWLREHADPLGHFGHTYLWFQVDDATYERFLNEARRFPPTRLGQELCAGQALVPLPPDARRAFSVSEDPARNTSWIACVDTARGTDFEMTAGKGALYVGHYGEDRVCQTERLLEGQAAWYRLEPGVHAFCVAEIPNRRPRLAYVFKGEWLAHGGPASIAVREAPVLHRAPVFIE